MSSLILATTLAMAGQHDLADLAKARFDAASKLYDTAWISYRENRVSTGFVNFTSVRLLRAELELSDKKDTQIAPFEHHLSRVKKTQDLVAKVAALGRTNDLEANETSYYRAEAEYWLAHARSSRKTTAAEPGP